MLSRALLVLAFRARDCLAELQVGVLWESPPVPSLSASLHLDVNPLVVQIFQSPFLRQNSISSLEPRPFHVGSTALQEVFCELICTQANHASSPPGVRLTKRLVPTTATTDPSVRQLGCSHFMVGDQREYLIHQTCA